MKKKPNYDWINNPNMDDRDKAALKRIKDLLEAGETEEAMHYASWNCDTFIRDAIPATVWKYMGGNLLPKGEENLKKEKGQVFFILPKEEKGTIKISYTEYRKLVNQIK